MKPLKQICVGAAIVQNGKILLTKRSMSKSRFPGYWVFAAGSLKESDESLEAAVSRRVKEEIGIEFTPTQKIGFYETIFDDGRIIGLMFYGDWSGQITIDEDEISEFRFCSYQEAISKDLGFQYRKVIDELKERGLII